MLFELIIQWYVEGKNDEGILYYWNIYDKYVVMDKGPNSYEEIKKVCNREK